MRVLFAGSVFCEISTLKRLLLLSDAIGFMDRPSVMFGHWGTIGHATPARKLRNEDRVVEIFAYAPPSTDLRELYHRYFEVDLMNTEFRKTFLEGLRDSHTFATKFIQLGADYKGMTGHEVRKRLLGDSSLIDAAIRLSPEPGQMFRVESAEGRRDTLRMLLAEASIHVTSAMLGCENTQCVPITDDEFLAKLIAIRASAGQYVGGVHVAAPFLGLEIAKSVIPEAALAKLSIEDVLEYRKESSQAYRAWSAELNRLASQIDALSPSTVALEVPKIMANDVAPKLIELEQEMIGIRDKLFSGIIKEVTKWAVPCLSLGWIANLSWAGAVAAFAGSTSQVIPHLVDYFQSKRETARRHALAYLVGVAPYASRVGIR